MAKVIELRPAAPLDFSKVQEICKAHEGKRGDLLIVLQKIQGVFGYVPKSTLEPVAQFLGVTSSEIFGVVLFTTGSISLPAASIRSGPVGERLAISAGLRPSSIP